MSIIFTFDQGGGVETIIRRLLRLFTIHGTLRRRQEEIAPITIIFYRGDARLRRKFHRLMRLY